MGKKENNLPTSSSFNLNHLVPRHKEKIGVELQNGQRVCWSDVDWSFFYISEKTDSSKFVYASLFMIVTVYNQK